MRICPDTNVIVRAIVVPATPEDERQAGIAQRILGGAEIVVLTVPALCEVAWVLRSAYRVRGVDVASTLLRLINAANILCDRAVMEFGLNMAETGGDLADGVIAEAGFLAGAERFVSFDQRAVRLVAATGRDARVPA